jgi:competence protein ComEC
MILFGRLPPLLIDAVLVLILLLSGVLATMGAKPTGRHLQPFTGETVTTLIELRGFGERLDSEWVRVDGCLRYVARKKNFQAIDQMAAVTLGVTTLEPVPGMIIAANGSLSRPDRRKNPGGVSQAEIQAQKGLLWSFRSGKGDWKILGKPDCGIPGRSIESRARAEIGRRFDSMLTEEQAGFLKGILLGARGQIPAEKRNRFSRAGVYHILAISGLHVGIISGICFLLLTILRIPPFPKVFIVLSILLIYGFLAGMKPSIQRAIVMAVSIMLATAMARKIDVVNLLYLLAAFLAFLSPHSLWNIGFQMSFLATWGILVLYPALYRGLHFLRPRRFAVPHFLLQIALVSLCAQAPLVPVIASSFHSLSPISPIANMIVLPVTSILIPTGLISLIVQPVSLILSIPFFEVTAMLIEILFSAVNWFSNCSVAALRVSSFGTIGTVSYYSILFLASLCLERRIKRETTLLFLLLISTTLTVLSLFSHERSLRVSYLDVGQGDCTVIEFPTGEIMIMDGGPARGQWDAGRAVIDPYLLDRGFDQIDLLSFSHPQLDHVGGFPSLMNRYRIRALLEPGQPNPLDSYLTILEDSIERKILVCWPRRGDSFSVGAAELRVLHPSPDWIDEYPDQDNVNNASLVIKLTYRGVSFLMTGDIGIEVETDLRSHIGEQLAADVLKVSHHGSRYSTTAPFLDSVNPRVAVISVGRHNNFGHPSPTVLSAMRERGVDVFRTDIEGAIVFVVGDAGFEVYDGSNRLLGRYVE